MNKEEVKAKKDVATGDSPPPPPEQLVGSKHDRVHESGGKARPAKTVRNSTTKEESMSNWLGKIFASIMFIIMFILVIGIIVGIIASLFYGIWQILVGEYLRGMAFLALSAVLIMLNPRIELG